MIWDTTMPLISFIVPVYNTEKYLHQCIGSILHQLENCELILIDDGSTDSSGSICEKYATEYPAIKFFRTENKGPSHARNLGVDNAQGRYIAFLDSDDFINHDFVRNFEYANITADVIFYPMEKLLMNGQRIPMGDGICSEKTRNLKSIEVLSHISKCPKFPASPCGKLVCLNFLKKHQIHFAFNRISEDYDWTYQLLQHAQSFDFFSGGRYTYRQMPQSRSNTGGLKSVEDQLAILTNWEQRAVPKVFRRLLNVFLAYEYAMILSSYGALSKKEKDIYRHEIFRCAYLLKYGKSWKLRCICLASKVFGIDFTAQLLCTYINWRNKWYGKK